jgi:hypothetical protein
VFVYPRSVDGKRRHIAGPADQPWHTRSLCGLHCLTDQQMIERTRLTAIPRPAAVLARAAHYRLLPICTACRRAFEHAHPGRRWRWD